MQDEGPGIDGGNIVNWNRQLAAQYASPTLYEYYKSLLRPRSVIRAERVTSVRNITEAQWNIIPYQSETSKDGKEY